MTTAEQNNFSETGSSMQLRRKVLCVQYTEGKTRNLDVSCSDEMHIYTLWK